MQYTEGECLLCGNKAQVVPHNEYDGIFFRCDKCGRFTISEYAQDYLKGIDENKFKACAYYYLSHYRKSNKPYLIVKNKCEDSNDIITVTVDEIMNLYPNTISEKIDKILLNMVDLNSDLGAKFTMNYGLPNKIIPFFFLSSNNVEDELKYIFELLKNLNLIESAGWASNATYYTIGYKGWQRITELQKQNTTHKQGFVAMWFTDSMKDVRAAINEVFLETGYNKMIIDEKQHNNQIVPEILYEIQNSDFVVADLTGNRNGVYYEAGYALGLGKPVILLTDSTKIKEGNDNVPHFDVAQVNQIRYENIEDLKKQLFNRITATIGNLKKPNAELKK